MARLSVMSGPGVPSCLLLLAALSSAGVTDGAKDDAAKTVQKVDAAKTVAVSQSKDLAPQESKKVRYASPSKRHIRKFDFDAEFATYLGLASQADTARYLAGDPRSSFRAPTAFKESPDGSQYPHLRLIPGSTPASFAYFTQIYPDEHSDGEVRIELFSPVIHPLISEREKARYHHDNDEPERYERTKSNYYPSDIPLYAPPTSQSYFGRYSNKQKYSESSEDNDDYGPKSNKLQPSKQSSPQGFDDDSTPDYKMGYRHVGMYQKFHEEDLYPKKTSSEWIPLNEKSKLRNKHKQDGDRDTNYYDPDGYNDAHVSPEDFDVGLGHDEEITRIKTNIDKDPPYSTNNFDLAEKKVPSIGKFRTKGSTYKGTPGYSVTETESPFEPAQRVRTHKRRRKKKKQHHHYGRPGHRPSPVVEAGVPFTKQDYKAPSFEFHNPVTSYVTPPYSPPESPKGNFKTEPYKNHPQSFDAHNDLHKPHSSVPSEPFRTGPENDLTITGEADKDISLEETPESPEEPADFDYEPAKLDDIDTDYHVTNDAGSERHAKHPKDFDKGPPPSDGELYGSFETFDSQLDSGNNKKFEPFVQFPFDEQRKKLANVVEELIQSGKSRRRK